MARVLQRTVERVSQDPVGFWLSRMDPISHAGLKSNLNGWMRWLHKQPGWEGISERELLIKQLTAEDDYEILDLLLSYVNSLPYRKRSKQHIYSCVNSFFTHNRCPLPKDTSYRIRGDRPPVQAKLTIPDIVEALHGCNVKYRSIFLFKFQSMQDNARLRYLNLHCRAVQ